MSFVTLFNSCCLYRKCYNVAFVPFFMSLPINRLITENDLEDYDDDEQLIVEYHHYSEAAVL